ncbi:putative Lipoprotein [Pseudomonas viridiflava]|uniref:Putative Lipoprotein n=1 Tax=Pseudomonas viridiflava TaxID=33069 RepID=A0A3M5PBV1_PSEVI|nr:putative Lipoprotein [Pseudomonas viridiflava]
MLSQGYIITSSDPKMIAGRKSFQQTGETHIEISFNLVCAADVKAGSSTMFANALQDRYALKKTNNSASLGVGVLGSLSMPIGSTDDSMVKVASETVASAKFYERFFGLVENFLPPDVKQAAHIVEKPKADLGVPDAAPAAVAPKAAEPAKVAPKAAADAPKAEPVAEPKAESIAPAASEPVPAPDEPASFKAEPVTPPQDQPVETTAPAPVETPPVQ